jgi:dihydroorotase
MTRLEIPRPDDWHLHLRDGAALRSVLPHTALRFARAIVMPNLRPPVTTTAQALAYRGRILEALPSELAGRFTPLMTLYLTESTTPEEIARRGPAGRSTRSSCTRPGRPRTRTRGCARSSE